MIGHNRAAKDIPGNARAAAAYEVLQSERLPEEIWFTAASITEALLAVAYEQRTANLIAYAQLTDGGDDPALLGMVVRARLGLTE